MSRKNKLGKALSATLATSMLFGMSLPAVQAKEIAICSVQNFESAASATEADWTWNTEHSEPTIASNIGDNTGKALTLDTNTTDGSEMIYSFTTKYRFTLKMKLYMSNANAGTYLRFVNSNNDSMDITCCGWGSNVYQESSYTVLGTYTNGWNDVEITVDPVLKTFSFRLGNVPLNETTGTKVPSTFFDYDIASFKVIKVKDGDATTVAVDDFSITAEDGFEWNGEKSTLPYGTTFNNGLTETYETDALNDTTKGSSVAIGTVTDNSPMLQVSPSFGNLKGNTAFSYSFDLGINNFSESRTTDPSYFFQFFENSAVIGNDYGFNIDATGKINFFGTETDYSINAGKWHTIKYVMASNGANTKQNASLYIDGKYVTSATLNIRKTEAASKIDRLRFCNNSTSSIMYVDNVKLERLETPSISSTDSGIESMINLADYQIIGSDKTDITAGEFLEKTTGAVVKKDGSAAPADALLKDCDIYSTTTTGELISWSNVQSGNNDIFNENFNSFTTGNVDADGVYTWQNYSDGKFLSAYPNGATVSVSAGFDGKTADDMSIVMEGKNITSAISPFIQLNNLSLGMVATIDADIYVDGEQDAKIHNKAGNMLAEFLKDGSVKVCDQTMDFNWKDETKDSKWMKISICIDTVKTETTLLINNKIVGTVNVTRSMPECRFASFYDGTDQSGVFAIDNLYIYEGLPKDYAVGNIDVQKNGNDCAATVDVKYANNLPLMIVVAEYDAQDRFVDATLEELTVSNSKTVETTKTLINASNKVRAFAWDQNSMKPYVAFGAAD